METKLTIAQHLLLIDNVNDLKKQHRDVVLILIVGNNYNRVYESELSMCSGSLAVSDYFSELVDKLFNNGEYDKALAYAFNKIFKEYQNPNTIGMWIWDYFNHTHGTFLDWYYADLANSEIDKFLNNQTK